jgi:release factor glutamine methyltransferase
MFINESVKQLIEASTTVPAQSGPPRVSALTAEEFEQDAIRLAAHFLGLPGSDLPTRRELTSAEIAGLQSLIDRRADGVPVGHLTGSAVLGGVTVAVGPGVFVPRVHSERVLAHSLAAIEGVPHPLVIDLCTGTGAVALAVAHARPDATVHAVDIDALALDYARRNSERQVAAGDTAIVLHDTDVTDPDLLSELDGTVDLLVALPPFMQDGDVSWLPAEFSEHQPTQAIFSGPDGLDVTRHIVTAAARLLRPGGTCVIEHGALHGESLPEILRDQGSFENITGYPDTAGWPLYVAATRKIASPDPHYEAATS